MKERDLVKRLGPQLVDRSPHFPGTEKCTVQGVHLRNPTSRQKNRLGF